MSAPVFRWLAGPRRTAWAPTASLAVRSFVPAHRARARSLQSASVADARHDTSAPANDISAELDVADAMQPLTRPTPPDAAASDAAASDAAASDAAASDAAASDAAATNPEKSSSPPIQRARNFYTSEIFRTARPLTVPAVEHLVPKDDAVLSATLELSGFMPDHLDVMAYAMRYFATTLTIPTSPVIHPKSDLERWSVVRGHFVHGKSKEAFERLVHKRVVQCYDATPEVIDALVKYTAKHLPPGVDLNIEHFTSQPLSYGQETLVQLRDALAKRVAVLKKTIKPETRSPVGHRGTVAEEDLFANEVKLKAPNRIEMGRYDYFGRQPGWNRRKRRDYPQLTTPLRADLVRERANQILAKWRSEKK